MWKAIELRQKRAALVEKAGAILKRAFDDAKRQLTPEERQEWDALHAEADELKAQYDVIERQEAADAEMNESRLRRRDETGRREGPSNDPAENAERERGAFRSWLRYGREGMTDAEIEVASFAGAKEMRDAWESLPPERRKLFEQRAQTVTTTGGGYTIPEGFQSDLDIVMVAFGGARGACRILPTASGNALPWPTMDDTANSGRLLGINTAVTTTDIAVGQKMLNAYKYSSDAVLLPSELAQDSGVPIESIIKDALGQRIGRITNNHWTVGDGSSKPQGIVTAAADSGATMDISSGLTYQNLLDLEHSVDPAYRSNPNTAFMFSDAFLKLVKGVVDLNGRPIFREALSVPGGIDQIMGYKFTINQDVPTPATATNKCALFGDLHKHVIRIVRPMIMLRLVERYADADQIGFFGFERSDSELINTAAVKYMDTQA